VHADRAPTSGIPTGVAILIAVGLLLGFVPLGCAARPAGATGYLEASRNDPRKLPYVVGPSDVLRITVWKDPSLSTEGVVGPGGGITMPLVGELTAAGRTVKQIQDEAARRLAAFIKDAVVTVAVVEVNSYRFTVAGNVEHRGMFSPRYYVTVSEAIALAGGPNRYASADSVVVIRPSESGTMQRIAVDYDEILSGKSPAQDIVVLARDTVLVP
jgi:polysaccharide export outer membrane protein